jgi:hypothetical protein
MDTTEAAPANAPGGSRWNAWHDRVLATDLDQGEWKLATALARQTLGWCVTEKRLGRRLLMQTARIDHTRTFENARAGLVAKGLIDYVPGRKGPGGGGLYRLLITAEMADVQRPIETANGRPTAANASGEMAAAQRPRIGSACKTMHACNADADDGVEKRRAFDDAVAAISLHGPKREMVFAHYCENPGRVTAIVADVSARRDVRNPGGLFVRLIESDFEPETKIARTPYELAERWVRTTGWEMRDEMFNDLLGERAGLTVDQLDELRALRAELLANKQVRDAA